MTLLIVGLLLWTGAHFFRRLAPDARARMGNAGKGIVAIGSVIAIVLMVIGYRRYDANVMWDLGSWTVHVNNTLMLLAIALFFVRDTKSRFRGKLRHPMLTGFLVWVVAHLLVNGDTGSLVLFGGLGLWAVAEIHVLNRVEQLPEKPTDSTVQGDIRLAVQTLIVFAVVAGIHTWLGRWPFPG